MIRAHAFSPAEQLVLKAVSNARLGLASCVAWGRSTGSAPGRKDNFSMGATRSAQASSLC